MPLEHEDERETVAAKREDRGADNGRAPDSPTDLGGTGLMATLKRTFKEFSADNITDWAAALTYYGVLAMFPALIALVSIVGLLGSSATDTLLENVGSLAPGPAKEILTSTIENLAGNQGAAGIAFIIGLALALNSASSYISAFTPRVQLDLRRRGGAADLEAQAAADRHRAGADPACSCSIAVAVTVSGPLAEEVGKVVGRRRHGGRRSGTSPRSR